MAVVSFIQCLSPCEEELGIKKSQIIKLFFFFVLEFVILKYLYSSVKYYSSLKKKMLYE